VQNWSVSLSQTRAFVQGILALPHLYITGISSAMAPTETVQLQ